MIYNHCLFYVAGLLVAFAYEDISYKKVATQSKTPTGQNFEASNAVDGNISTCMRTIVIGSTSEDKTVWWKVDLGGVYNIYSIHIQFKTYDGLVDRQRGRFAGFSLYVSNYDVSSVADIKGSTLCYKDGPQLPPLNFTRICTVKGRYVIYYTERLEGVIYPEGYEVVNVYTELCEVIVQGCKNASLFGINCDTPCPTNCIDSTCHIQSGACFICKPGWTGTYCNTKCKEGWYGVNCSQQCVGHCRDGAACNHETGQCDKGCATGWTGTMCNIECSDGTHGYNCVNNCSGHCLDNTPCNKQTGYCASGCKPGYADRNCSKECPAGKFGLDCRKRCSEHCLNKYICDHVSGECTSGCLDGFVGTHCNKSCSEGYFGTNCSRVCSPNCSPDICRHTDGLCICAAGSTAGNCTIDALKANKPTSSGSVAVTVGGTVGSSVIVVIGVILVFFAIRLKRKSTKMAKRQSFMMEAKPIDKRKPNTELSNIQSCRSNTNDIEETTYALPEKTKRGPPTNKNIPVRNMKAQISNMSLNENAGFKSEYHDIPRGELHPCLEGKKPENKAKNRYTTIFPYDHSRVTLKNVASDQGGYINANYIEASI